MYYKPRSENKYKSDHENFIVYVSNDKNSLPFKRRNSEHEPNSQNIESRNNRRRKGKSRKNSTSKKASSAHLEQNRENNMVTEFERATTLASKLAVKLVVSLPPESDITSGERISNQPSNSGGKALQTDFNTHRERGKSPRRRERSSSGGKRRKSLDMKISNSYTNSDKIDKVKIPSSLHGEKTQDKNNISKCHDRHLDVKSKRSKSHSGNTSAKDTLSNLEMHQQKHTEKSKQREPNVCLEKYTDKNIGAERKSIVSSKVSTYDNFGFDKSPKVRKHQKKKTQANPRNIEVVTSLDNSRQEQSKNSSDKKHLGLTGNNLDIKGPSQTAKNTKYYPMNYTYETINHKNFLEESDSDCSSELKRRSPPTQIQSMSDDSSNSSNKKTAQSYSHESDLNISSDDEFDHEMGKFENNRRRNESAISENEENMHYSEFPRFAANPFVKVPDSIYPTFFDINTGGGTRRAQARDVES